MTSEGVHLVCRTAGGVPLPSQRSVPSESVRQTVPSQVAQAVFAPGDRIASAGIADAHIAQTVSAVGGAFTAANIAKGVFAPGGACARVPDVTKAVFAQSACLAVLTLIAGVAEAVLAIGAVGCMYRTRAEGYQYHGQ